ncbi:MAG: D-alanyl-D-alanine carboxypeptidase family protein [Akkermansia sp.]|nr:D-alanyl-D-alanine carboxypeptidase family protein [Akkermansia sp.]
MRFFATITSIFLSLGTIGCQSFGSAEYIPDATPVPYQISLPSQRTLPANFPTRPCVKPVTPPRTPRCSAACVMDALTGKILYSHNGKRKLQVASTQKLVTALIVAEQGNLNKKVTIQSSDTKADPTKLGFRAGEVYSRGSLLNALMVKSYNDVALALARDCAGSVPRFVRMMNTQARRMYMKNSRFANPNGLPADQYSTAEDMAKCGYFVYRNPILRSIICQKSSTFKKHNGKVITMNNTNKLLTRHSWVTGMKTGYTRAAGRCLVSSGGFNGRHVIVVVLGCHPSRIWNESEKLLKWGLLGS